MSSPAHIEESRQSDDAPAMKAREIALTSTSLPDEGGSTGQTPSISDLFRELQETNRLLRALAQKEKEPALPAPLLTLARKGWTPRMGDSEAQVQSTPEPELVREKARQLVDELAHEAFDPNNKSYLDNFCSSTFMVVSRKEFQKGQQGHDPEVRPRDQVRLVVRSQDTLSSGPIELLWNWRPGIARRKVPLTAQQLDALRQQWPVVFDLDKLTWSISRASGWILGKTDNADGALCAAPLLYGPGRNVLSANAVLDRSEKGASVASMMLASDLVSPGSLWHFTTPVSADGGFPLSRLALIAAVCLVNPDNYENIQDFLHEFCAEWKPLYLRGSGRDFRGWTGGGGTAYQHTIRCFSADRTEDEVDTVPYVRCHRETGQFPSLSGTRASSFVERRMSIICRWLQNKGTLSFSVVIVGDFQNVRSEVLESNDLFTDWEDRRFTVRGDNAGYHVLQSALHRMLAYWEKEWSECLDELENSVNTKLHDILTDEASNKLMFDTSFARSRVYFKTLEMLRIFADTIRETSRDLQEMDPNRLLQGSFRRAGFNVRSFLREDPAKDEALWENWQTLSEFQQGAEDRLLRRIAEKTEEIKSLRDGLFNATSLREASRSTTMNRYVIVFTIMTVLYLPPSFTASLFGTPLFEAEEQAETVDRFRLSTIIVCVITYTLAFVLIWVADKWDIAGSLYRDTRAVWSESWTRLKNRSVTDFGSGSREKLNPGADDTGRRMSV